MDVIIYLVLIYGGLFLFGWIIKEIGKWNDERKSKIRDEVAKEVLPQTDIGEKLLSEYKNKLKKTGYNEKQKYSWLYNYHTEKKNCKGLLGKCPNCIEGYLRVIDGKYGKFIGCSGYPKWFQIVL
ncbi:topoisomerase DNA-binding C4 zinc finger domain-containing protein [Patescibacteria group bacterium]|nr:topoisomerase DNA-binding C4 zinc finger domain-containing protein [Patescibacteria group bacterium]MBU1868290.1 topoisomerase DNA-binding C4 zinc finger domain-containing protein [Patescibacteria group bacterium]